MSALSEYRRYIPDGFRDEDGVWHDGPHRIAFDAAVARAEKCEEALRAIAYAAYDVNESAVADLARAKSTAADALR